MASGGKHGKYRSGSKSRAATGARKRKEASVAESEQRAASLPPVAERLPIGTRVERILEAHAIKLEPANLEIAHDLVQAGDAADYIFGKLLDAEGEASARMASAIAVLQRSRRACMKDLGLPGDPDERDDFRRPAPAAAPIPAPAPNSGLNSFLDD